MLSDILPNGKAIIICIPVTFFPIRRSIHSCRTSGKPTGYFCTHMTNIHIFGNTVPVLQAASFFPVLRLFPVKGCLQSIHLYTKENPVASIPLRNHLSRHPVCSFLTGYYTKICSLYGPAHPPVFHPQCDCCAVLALLYPHSFIQDPFFWLWYPDPSFIIWKQPIPVIVQILI